MLHSSGAFEKKVYLKAGPRTHKNQFLIPNRGRQGCLLSFETDQSFGQFPLISLADRYADKCSGYVTCLAAHNLIFIRLHSANRATQQPSFALLLFNGARSSSTTNMRNSCIMAMKCLLLKWLIGFLNGFFSCSLFSRTRMMVFGCGDAG